MQGSLSVGANLDRLSAEDLQKCKDNIAFYKKIRPLVQFGNLYRLKTADKNGYYATEYADGDGASLVMNKGIVIDDWNPLSSVIVEFEKV